MTTTRDTAGRWRENIAKGSAAVAALAAALFLVGTGSALASISQPDVVYFGTALNASAGGTVSIVLSAEQAALKSFTIGSDKKYLLRVPMDEVGSRIPGTARQGDSATIFVDGVAAATVTIPKFGTITRLDLGSRSEEQWSQDHPGDDGSGDMNRNGISDLDEYLSGKDPASCVWTAVDSSHAETAVFHPLVLQSCLGDAGGDGRHNFIKVAAGSFAGNFAYRAGWGEGFDLTLAGGYDPAGSGNQESDPSLTVLNGDTDADGSGNGTVLSIDTDINKTVGRVRIQGVTLTGGKAPAGEYGGGLRAVIYQGELELVGNVFTGNSADGGGAVSAETRGSGAILVVDNLIHANNASSAAAARIRSTASGAVTFLNNTVVNNAATTKGEGESLRIDTALLSAVEITNNIISRVSDGDGRELYVYSTDVGSTPLIAHNALDVNELFVTLPGFVPDASNQPYAPQFVSAATGDYRLAWNSPLIDLGIAHPRLPEKDPYGESRTAGGIELGAFQYQPTAVSTAVASDVTPTSASSGGAIAIGGGGEITSRGVCWSVLELPTTAGSCAENGSGSGLFSVSLTGLLPGTLYHVRAYATNASGTTYGEDRTFTTGAAITGICGASSGGTFVTIPATNLCSSGTASAVAGSGPWSWSCIGNGGPSANCSANLSTRTLSVSVTGSGDGSVNSSPSGIACSSGSTVNCSANFTTGTDVQLFATPASRSLFTGWSGDLSGTASPVQITMSGVKAVTATFDAAPKAKVGTKSFATLQEAYDDEATGTGSVIMLLEGDLAGSLTASRSIAVKLEGGYEATFEDKAATTTLKLPVAIRNGTVRMENIKIKGR